MSLVINHLRSHFHSATALAPGQTGQWLAALAAVDGDALGAELTGADEWLLIDRLPVALRWRADASATEVTAQWSAALRHALQQALANPADNAVVRYASRREALADLLYRSALGDRARHWAWVQMGLLERPGLGADEVLQRGVTLLCAEPAMVWPVLHRLVAAEPATAALTALLRSLPATQWQALLRASAQTAPYLRAQTESAPAAAPAVVPAPAPAPHMIATTEALRLLAWAHARQHFAARHRDILAVLIAALAWPGLGAAPGVIRARLQAVDAHLATVPGLAPGATHAPPTDHEPGLPTTTDVGHAATAPSATHPRPPVRPADLPAPPALPQEIEWLPTRWAGALFWLARIPASGLLDELAATATTDTTLAQMLGAIARALGVPADDAAMRAFCGGDPGADELPPAAHARAVHIAADIVANWAAWLDQAAPELPVPRLDAVCQRSGRLRFEPGWVELHLPLDGVHTAIRRLGLDLDPGWLPWLGCVLRICYDE